jgi:hypothetical protein
MTDIPPREPFLNILEALAVAKERGLTNLETAKRLNITPNTMHPSVEKLFNQDLLVKSSISPIKGSKNPRNANRIYVYHLKRFFPFYRPEEEGMMINMDETSSLRMEAIIIAILRQHNLTKIPVVKLRDKIGNCVKLKDFKRELNHMNNFLKDKNQLVQFNDAVHTRVRSLDSTPRPRSSIGLKSVHGSVSVFGHDSGAVPAAVPAAATAATAATEVEVAAPRAHAGTARNLAQYEQLADRLNVAPCGLPSNQ